MKQLDDNRPDFFSITTLGERGQIVVPKEARQALNLATGDKLIVLPSRRGDGILLMKEQNIKEIAQSMSEKADLYTQKSKKLYQKLKYIKE
jgi:AbrB family looped-hinge helix DNA binding protein